MEPKKEHQEDPCIDPADHVHEPRKHFRPFFIGGILLLLITLFLIGYIPRFFHWRELTRDIGSPPPPNVAVMEVKPDKKPVELVLPSTTDGHRITPIWARTNGYIDNFFCDIGDVVKNGELLAVIDTPEVDQQYLQTKADLESAIARLEIARISFNRWEELYKKNKEAVPLQEVDERRATYHGAEADVNSFLHNMERLEKLMEFKNIYAPFQGIIIERDIDLGTLITAGSNGNPQQLFRIAETDYLRVFVDVPQSYFRLIEVNGTADVFIQEFPNKVFRGTIARTAGALDPIARTLTTEIHIPNQSGEILVGLYAEVHFHLIPDTAYFIVPQEAVIIRAGNPQIAIVDEQNVVHIHEVHIGRDWGKTMEITSGLKENEKIVINPTDRIREGTIVNINRTETQPERPGRIEGKRPRPDIIKAANVPRLSENLDQNSIIKNQRLSEQNPMEPIENSGSKNQRVSYSHQPCISSQSD